MTKLRQTALSSAGYVPPLLHQTPFAAESFLSSQLGRGTPQCTTRNGRGQELNEELLIQQIKRFLGISSVCMFSLQAK